MFSVAEECPPRSSADTYILGEASEEAWSKISQHTETVHAKMGFKIKKYKYLEDRLDIKILDIQAIDSGDAYQDHQDHQDRDLETKGFSIDEKVETMQSSCIVL
jgi:hypothetical protein